MMCHIISPLEYYIFLNTIICNIFPSAGTIATISTLFGLVYLIIASVLPVVSILFRLSTIDAPVLNIYILPPFCYIDYSYLTIYLSFGISTIILDIFEEWYPLYFILRLWCLTWDCCHIGILLLNWLGLHIAIRASSAASAGVSLYIYSSRGISGIIYICHIIYIIYAIIYPRALSL